MGLEAGAQIIRWTATGDGGPNSMSSAFFRPILNRWRVGVHLHDSETSSVSASLRRDAGPAKSTGR